MPTFPSSDLPSATVHYRKPVRGSLVWWMRFLGVAAVILVLFLYLSRSQDARVFRVDLRWIGLCVGLTVCQLLLDAFVWHWLLAMQRIRYPYPKTLLAYLASQYLGLVTPNHVGELLAAGHISTDTGITFGYALSSVVMKKALATVAAVGFGIWSLPLLAGLRFLQGMQVVVWSVVVLVIFSATLVLWIMSLRRLARKWEKVSPGKIEMAEFWAGFSQLFTPSLLVPLGLSALAFSLLFFQLDAVLRAMGLGVSFALLARLMALSRVAARFLPLSVAGFGSKDVLLILLLGQYGIVFADGLAAVLLLLMSSHLVTLLLSGLAWWIKPLVVRRAAPASS